MKRLLLLTATILTSLTSFGQFSDWYKYTDAAQDAGILFKRHETTLFPDTTVISGIYDTSGVDTIGLVNLHNVGQIFDPKYEFFNDPQALSVHHPYALDSIRIYYKYYHVGDSTVDTLKVQFYQNAQIYNTDLYGFPNSQSVRYNWQTNNSTSPTFSREITVYLDSSDDTDGQYLSKSIAVPGGGLEINPQKLCAFSMSFIPGYEHDSGDTIDHALMPEKRLNQFVPSILFDENKFPDESGNVGLFAHTEERYDYNDSLKGFFKPGEAFSKNNRHLEAEFYITFYRNIEHVSSLSSLNLYPNPINNSQELTVEFKLDKQQELSFTITDITGRTLKQLETNNYQQGENKLIINVEGLASGMYYLNVINSDGQRTTKPIIIN